MAVVVVLGSIEGAAAAADPPDKESCADAYERAQRLRKAHELKASRSELLVCSRPECPAWVRRDCVPWLAEVDASMPSIIIVARNANGSARTDVRALIDGATVMDRLTEDPIALDPGPHVVVLIAPGVARVEQRITVREGERERRIEIKLTPLAEPAPTARTLPPRPPPSTGEESDERPVPPLVYVLAAVGGATGGFGTYFQISGMTATSDLDGCAPTCSQNAVDDARRSLWAGNILIGVGVVSLAAAAVFYLTRPAVPSH
jgi:hypothetical protein